MVPGVSYRMEVDPNLPRVVHALRISPTAPGVELRPELGDGAVFADGTDRGRIEVSEMVRRSGAVVGVNADFFPWTGDPLGAMVARGEIISRPDARRAILGWGSDGPRVGRLNWRGSATLGGIKVNLDGLNEETPENGVALFTAVAGQAVARPNCLYLVIDVGAAKWVPTGEVKGRVEMIFRDLPTLPVQPNKAVVAARGTAMGPLAAIEPGAEVTLSNTTSGFDWSKIDNVIGGGPFLVRGGKAAIDWREQGFKEAFATERHPRTAAGFTAEGDIWLVVIDGRQPNSIGATLAETARVMIALGCTDAINLDGGGSSVISLAGRALNRPSDGPERKVANAVLLFGGTWPPGPVTDMAIQGPARVTMGEARGYALIGADGRAIAQAEVFWSVSGSAWVDQGGFVRGLGPGAATLNAFYRGQWVSLPVRIDAPAAPGPGPR